MDAQQIKAQAKLQERADSFAYWFSTQGHWIYASRDEAIRVWQERGINGRENYSPAVAALLGAL